MLPTVHTALECEGWAGIASAQVAPEQRKLINALSCLDCGAVLPALTKILTWNISCKSRSSYLNPVVSQMHCVVCIHRGHPGVQIKGHPIRPLHLRGLSCVPEHSFPNIGRRARIGAGGG